MSSPDNQSDHSRYSLSVVIVTWNSASFLTRCIEELHRSKNVALEIIVVDNNSRDNTPELARQLTEENRIDQFFPQEKNTGCAGGNNIGWQAASHDLILMLNADCVVTPDCIWKMASELDQPETGCVGALLLYPNSKIIQHAGADIFPNGIADHPGREKNIEDSDVQKLLKRRPVDFVTGACLMYRKGDMTALGGFDEDYFPAYYEEADLCLRLNELGKTTIFLPDAIAYHFEMAGTGKISPQFIQMATDSRLKFMIKNTALSVLLTQFLLKEWQWFWRRDSRGTRKYLIRSYLHGLLFAVRTLVRFRKRSLP